MSIETIQGVTFFADIGSLNTHLNKVIGSYPKVIFLIDENTRRLCLPLISESADLCSIIEIQSGEINKNLASCEKIWRALTELNADRKSLLINLGGGVITDMGGFAASCFKRGIDFINIPTTLLAMVDASIGGKTAIDFDGYKNHIGLFSEAKQVLVCPEFLKTLDLRQIRSGNAEMVKHYLIADASAFAAMIEKEGITVFDIKRAIEIKSAIVAQDVHELSCRKILNFGHTVGHAIESFYLGREYELLHGEAIAIGMTIETLISERKGMLHTDISKIVCERLSAIFRLRAISLDHLDDIIALMLQDKKNKKGIILMALIDHIGSCQIDVSVSVEEIRAAILKYNTLL